MHLRKGNTIHSIDERFCVHAKKTLDFLIRDLYRIVTESGKKMSDNSNEIEINGIRTHNLKNIDTKLEKRQLI